MHLWRASFDPKTGGHSHEFAPGFGHTLVIPMITNVFRVLRVSASVHDGAHWWVLHSEPGVTGFEVEHEGGIPRVAYNAARMNEVAGSARTVRGEHAGHVDYFVPIIARGDVVAILVVGGIATHPKAGTEIVDDWRSLTGRQGHPEDPEFSSYLNAALSMLVLDGKQEAAFARLLEVAAKLLGGEGAADALANELESLHLALRKVRFVERDWAAVASMLDDRFPRTWSGGERRADLRFLGLSRAPDHVLVALATSRDARSDPVEEIVRREAFQRAAVSLAERSTNVLAGQASDRGVVFLLAGTGSATDKRLRLIELADRARQLARRRFELSLCSGASVAISGMPLARSYALAFGAAETALAQGQKLVFAAPDGAEGSALLRRLRRALREVSAERADVFTTRFEHFAEAVAVQVGRRIELARLQLEVGFDHLLEPLRAQGALDDRGLAMLQAATARGADRASNIGELLEVYRVAMCDVAEAMSSPVAARQGRSLRRALDYIHQHYAEPLPASRVAKIGGFAPAYFSRLFKARERMTFAQYVAGLRLDRAKQLLTGAELGVSRVAELSGFGSPQYLARVFQRSLGLTPLEYRREGDSRPGRQGQRRLRKK